MTTRILALKSELLKADVIGRSERFRGQKPKYLAIFLDFREIYSALAVVKLLEFHAELET